MNLPAVRAIYFFELARSRRTLFQSIASPVLSTALYFIVFGSAIGSRMQPIDGVTYGAFIVPGLILLTVLTESISNASFGIYLPRFTGTIYEILSAPISAFEVILGFVGAAATKSVILGLIIFFTARLFVSFDLVHPLWALGFLVLISVAFALFGFILGLWADGFEKLQVIPLMVISPLTFLGGTFYSIDMLPPFWRNVALFNPIVYLVDGFRWAFYDIASVRPEISFGMTFAMLSVCVAIVAWAFKTGYRLRS
ncbi:ABC transporter permease [Rhodoblastus sp.]|jgi:ABC-2 type transport system permease protein|uniref:ABC transporter permease n=1 Tax=Rhodoblastus sp. TaxID=1962975 RepID=UPI0026078DEA|nr:ABC transporter permease [Rhodoblastus sp.]